LIELATYKSEYWDEENQQLELYFHCPRANKTLRLCQLTGPNTWEEYPEEIKHFLVKEASIGCLFADKNISAIERENIIKEISK
jgi:hypothetical protein